MWTRAAVTTALLMAAAVAQAQDSTGTRLEPVRVTVTRDAAARSVLDLPFGLSRLVVDSARSGIRRASFTELLLGVPGLAISNRYNPTQDPRLAVRGFGSRSAFGIRGVRIVRDGIPLTLADGQTAVDFVDLEAVGSAEVLRGAAGALYGNASGGVVELKSADLPLAGQAIAIRSVHNEDATRWSAQGSGASAGGAIGWRGTVSRNVADGPRDYARFRSTSALGDMRVQGDAGTLRLQYTWYDSPLAENPGAVTAAELAATPFVADSQNIRRRATKTVSQHLLSLIGERGWDGGSASASVFGGVRELENPQPFAWVAFARRTMGATGRLQQQGVVREHTWRTALGVDVLSQRDDRRNYENCAGLSGAQRPVLRCPDAADRGIETLHQLEKVASAGIFARADVSRANVAVTATLRGDQTAFSVRDRRVTAIPGGALSSITMGAVTPMVGVTVRARPTMSVYANFAGSFETPTTTELATQPDGSAGLNPELDPQRGRTVEVGAKGVLGAHLLFDVSLFDIATRDELIAFEVPGSAGRRYFRNAGRTLRRGGELGVTAALGVVDVGGQLTRLTYTYEDFVVSGNDLAGNRVPGVAPTTAALFATARRRGAFATVEMQHAARTAADDANVNFAGSYTLWNVRTGLTAFSAFGVAPVIGIDNVFDRTWVSNIVTNATRGRFFEPGAGRRVYVAISATLTRGG